MKQDSKVNNQPSDGQDQAKLFERAMSFFHSSDFAHAKSLFEQAAAGPAVDLVHAARMHVRMCDRRLGSAAPRSGSPDDLYTHSVALMARGEYAQAEPLLRQAVSASPGADHFLYALSLCLGHLGDIMASEESLRRAIDLQPSNRAAARRDAEFQPLLKDGPLRELVLGERS